MKKKLMDKRIKLLERWGHDFTDAFQTRNEEEAKRYWSHKRNTSRGWKLLPKKLTKASTGLGGNLMKVGRTMRKKWRPDVED